MEKGATVWLTGLPGAGKSTIAATLKAEMEQRAISATILDGDELRRGLNSDLGFSAADRAENVRRVAEVARLFAAAGVVAIVALISPHRESRERARQMHRDDGLRFIEVFIDTPVDVCAQRDPKGLYARSRNGTLTGLTGVDDTYEPPQRPELVITTEGESPDAAVLRILETLIPGGHQA
jgi:bifunctional enzyme CysN/CysC